MVLAVLVELGGCHVQSQSDVVTQLITGSLHGLHDEVQGCLGGFHGRRESALIAQAGGQSLVLDDLLQRVVHLGAHAQSLVERHGADGGDHEFLHVHTGIRVRATVEDVHHWHGQQVCVWSADVAEQWQSSGLCSGVSHGHGDTQDGVCTEAGLVFGIVQLQHGDIDGALIIGFESGQLVVDLIHDVGYGLLHALAQVTVVFIAQFVCFVDAGRGAGGDCCAADDAVVQTNLNLHGGVTTGIENFAGNDLHNFGHCGSLLRLGEHSNWDNAPYCSISCDLFPRLRPRCGVFFFFDATPAPLLPRISSNPPEADSARNARPHRAH